MEKKEILLRWILTAASVLLLALLAWQCLDIYLVGNSPANLDENGLYIQSVYRAEDVMARLGTLGIWAAGYLALLITVWVMMPVGKKHVIPMEPDNRLRLMKKKLPQLPEKAWAEENLRKKIQFGAGAVVMVCTVMSMIFLLNREHFASWDLEMVMGQLLVHTLPWIIAAFAAVIWAAFLCRRSLEREIDLLKGIPGSRAVDVAAKPAYLNPMRIVLYALAVILTVTGIGNGGMRDVLIKAINICTECIGLG